MGVSAVAGASSPAAPPAHASTTSGLGPERRQRPLCRHDPLSVPSRFTPSPSAPSRSAPSPSAPSPDPPGAAERLDALFDDFHDPSDRAHLLPGYQAGLRLGLEQGVQAGVDSVTEQVPLYPTVDPLVVGLAAMYGYLASGIPRPVAAAAAGHQIGPAELFSLISFAHHGPLALGGLLCKLGIDGGSVQAVVDAAVRYMLHAAAAGPSTAASSATTAAAAPAPGSSAAAAPATAAHAAAVPAAATPAPAAVPAAAAGSHATAVDAPAAMPAATSAPSAPSAPSAAPVLDAAAFVARTRPSGGGHHPAFSGSFQGPVALGGAPGSGGGMMRARLLRAAASPPPRQAVRAETIAQPRATPCTGYPHPLGIIAMFAYGVSTRRGRVDDDGFQVIERNQRGAKAARLTFTKNERINGRPIVPFAEPWLGSIHLGLKKFDARLVKGKTGRFDAGDTITGQSDVRQVGIRITRRRTFASFGAAWLELGADLVPHHVHCITSAKEANDLYQTFFPDRDISRELVVVYDVQPIEGELRGPAPEMPSEYAADDNDIEDCEDCINDLDDTMHMPALEPDPELAGPAATATAEPATAAIIAAEPAAAAAVAPAAGGALVAPVGLGVLLARRHAGVLLAALGLDALRRLAPRRQHMLQLAAHLPEGGAALRVERGARQVERVRRDALHRLAVPRRRLLRER